MSKEIKILYMNSFSRSGETLMQRTLNAHKNISTLIQLKKTGTEIKLQYDIFKTIKKNKPNTITLSEKEISELNIPANTDILLVKNAIFLNKEKKYSFMLLRNPYSVYSSYKKMVASQKDPRQQMKNWVHNIDSNLLGIINTGDFLDAFMSKYENFINDPENTLRSLLSDLSINWDPSILTAHENYEVGKTGHGGIKLWQPIRGEKAGKLPLDLSSSEMDRIYGYCSTIMDKVGYRIQDSNLLY